MKASKDFEEGKRKNRPSILMPIVNSVLTVGLIALLIFFRVRYPEEFSVGYFVIILFLLLLFPVASWYNSYFSKKRNTKIIDNFEKEANLLVEYSRRYREFKRIETNLENQVFFHVSNQKMSIPGKVSFDKESCCLGYPDGKTIIVGFGVSYAGFEIDPKSHEIVAISGLMPRSIWVSTKLKEPTKKEEATLVMESKGFILGPRQLIQANRRVDTYYDNKTGWCCIGEKRIRKYDECYQIMSNAIVVLRGEEVSGLWIQLEPNLYI